MFVDVSRYGRLIFYLTPPTRTKVESEHGETRLTISVGLTVGLTQTHHSLGIQCPIFIAFLLQFPSDPAMFGSNLL